MRFCVDLLKYNGKRMQVSGWAAPKNRGDHVRLTLKNPAGETVPVEISEIPREDVLLSVYGESGKERYGFSFTLEGGAFENLTLYMENLSDAADHEETVLGLRETAAAWKKSKRPLHVLKRYFAAKDKKNFKRNELLADLDDAEKKYALWYDAQKKSAEELKKQSEEGISGKPLVSLLVPVYRPDAGQFSGMAASVSAQSYGNFELILANASQENRKLSKMLERMAAKDARIRVLLLPENKGISENTNAALKEAKGEWIGLLDQDDILSPDALYEMLSAASLNPAAEIVYSDEDKLEDETGLHKDPSFKTVYNDALLHSTNYICHFLMVKRALAEKIGGFRKEYDGAQDYDFILRCTEETSGPVLHVPKVLYSWRIHEGSTAAGVSVKKEARDAGARALRDAFLREGIDTDISPIPELPGRYRVHPKLKEEPLVSVIIPNKDHPADLKRCVESLLNINTYENLEVLIVENGSGGEETFRLYEELTARDQRIRLLKWNAPFNFAAIQNFAAKEAKGEFLLLLNNDTEVISKDFLKSMVFWGLRENTGAVGARLFYEDGTLQHCGVLVLVEGAAHHVYLMEPESSPGYMGRILLPTNLSAVTAACMLVKKSAFDAVGGMDECFTVAYNDVDFCLKLCDKGYGVVYDPEATLTHFESKSRGYEDTEEKKKRQKKEADLLYGRWPKRVGNDPFYSPNLGLTGGWYSLP